MDKVFSIKELSEITKLPVNTMHTYMGNYRFANFRVKQKIKNRLMEAYSFNRKFAYRLCDFLRIMHRADAVERWIEYCEQQENL